MGLGVAAYRQHLQALLPRGAAWPRDKGAQLTQLLDAAAAELARIDERGVAAIKESDPRTTAELLTEWERAAGLPGPCDGLAPTMQERRNALVGKLTASGGQSRAFYIALAAALGYPVTVTEFRPFRAGFSKAGESLTNGDWLHQWMVHAPETTVFPFKAGSSAGEPLRSWGEDRLECPIRDLKPAHTGVSFSYGG